MQIYALCVVVSTSVREQLSAPWPDRAKSATEHPVRTHGRRRREAWLASSGAGTGREGDTLRFSESPADTRLTQ